MASHVNRQPCDFIHLTQGLEIEGGFAALPHSLLRRRAPGSNVGCCGKKFLVLGLVFPAGGRSSESAELKTSAPDVSASLLTVRCCSSLVQLVKPCAGHLGCRAKPSTLRTAVKTWCSTAVQWDSWKLKGGWAARWIDLK